MRERVLVLDFDGVICDSIDECFVSSWTAYHTLYLGRQPAYMPISLKRDFARLRPLIRGGEDFMLIQEILEQGGTASRQSEFDAFARAAGERKMKLFHDLFYQARGELLEKDRQSWLAMNRIYPHVVSAFERIPSGAPVYILSTKKPDFIAEILTAKSIRMPRDRILYSGNEPKMDIVERLGAESGSSEAIFIDDQIEHLTRDVEKGPPRKAVSGPRITVFLATWGYVQSEWLREPLRVPTLTPQGFLSLIQREFS